MIYAFLIGVIVGGAVVFSLFYKNGIIRWYIKNKVGYYLRLIKEKVKYKWRGKKSKWLKSRGL